MSLRRFQGKLVCLCNMKRQQYIVWSLPYLISYLNSRCSHFIQTLFLNSWKRCRVLSVDEAVKCKSLSKFPGNRTYRRFRIIAKSDYYVIHVCPSVWTIRIPLETYSWNSIFEISWFVGLLSTVPGLSSWRPNSISRNSHTRNIYVHIYIYIYKYVDCLLARPGWNGVPSWPR